MSCLSLSLFLSGDFTFEVCLPSGCPPLGCVSVRLSLPSPRCLGDSAAISLLLPHPTTTGGGGGERERDSSRILCGPISLTDLVDVTGCAAQVCCVYVQKHIYTYSRNVCKDNF